MAKATLSFFDFSTFFRASCLVMVRALWIAELMMFLLYCLEMSMSFNSFSLCLRTCESLQILTSLSANEYGMFLHTWLGWHDVGKRY